MINTSLILFFVLILWCCGKRQQERISFPAKGYDRPVNYRDKTVAWIYEVDGKQGLRDTLGNILLPPKYDYIESWTQFGLMRTDSGGYDASGSDYVHYEMDNIGLIDYKGNILFEPQFDELNFNWQPFGLVSKDGKYGYIDTEGKIPIPLIYDSAGIFENGFAVVVTSTGYGLINLKGEYIIEPNQKYLAHWYATGFGKDTMLLVFEDYRAKMINSEGVIFDVLPQH